MFFECVSEHAGEPALFLARNRLGLSILLFPAGLAMGMLLARLARHWEDEPAGTLRPRRGAAAPRRIPGVAWAAGLLWAAEGWRAAGLARTAPASVILPVIELLFLSGLVLAADVDWKTMLIPDSLSLGGIAAGMFFSFLAPQLHLSVAEVGLPERLAGLAGSAFGAAAGIAVAGALRWAGGLLLRAKLKEIREKDPGMDAVLGLGDVKLLGCLGAFLGAEEIFPVLFLAAAAGSIGGVIMKLRSGDPGGATGWPAVGRRWRSGVSVFPFGPFLAGAAAAVLLFR